MTTYEIITNIVRNIAKELEYCEHGIVDKDILRELIFFSKELHEISKEAYECFE